MSAVCGITSYLFESDNWDDHNGLASLAGVADRKEKVVIPAHGAFTVMGWRGHIFDALTSGKGGWGIDLQVESGSRVGVAFISEKMSNVVARSARAFAKAVVPTIGVTASRTLTIPLAPFFKRSRFIGNPLASIEAPMRMANMKSDREIMFQVYPVDEGDHPQEVFYYESKSVTLGQVFEDLCNAGLVREGPTAWREHHHPRRGFSATLRFRKSKGGMVNV